VRIIERHEPPNQWPRLFTCANCQSILEVDANDIAMPGQLDGPMGWFTCPVCRKIRSVTGAETREASEFRVLHAKPHSYGGDRVRAEA
jgi:hypothetical protein